MKKGLLLCLLALIVNWLWTVNVSAENAQVAYQIERGETYSFENISAVSHDIVFDDIYKNYVVYYQDGSIMDYGHLDLRGAIPVPAGGKLVATAVDRKLAAKLHDDSFISNPEPTPAMKTKILNKYETSTYINIENITTSLLTNGEGIGYYRYFTYILYDSEGSIVDYSRISESKKIEIPAGYSIKLTATDNAVTVDGIYEMFDVVKNNTPAMKRTVIGTGETYTYTNKSSIAYNLLTNGEGIGYDRYFDYMLLYSDGTAKETVNNSTQKSISVPPGGSAKVTGIANPVTIDALYEKFDVFHANPLRTSYRVINPELYDQSLEIERVYSCDYILFSVDDKIIEYSVGMTSPITIPANGFVFVTPSTNVADPFVSNNTLEIQPHDQMAFCAAELMPDDTMKFTNTSVIDLEIYLNGIACDYELKNAEGTITGHKANSPDSSFIIPNGGSITLTSHSRLSVAYLNGYFEVVNKEEPVYEVRYIQLGDTEEFSNVTARDYSLEISHGVYDYVIYQADQSVHSMEMNCTETSIVVPTRCRLVLTPQTSSITIYALSEVFSIQERHYPVFARQALSFGESSVFFNKGKHNAAIMSSTNSYCDYSATDSAGNVTETKEMVEMNTLIVDRGGKATIQVRTSNDVFGGLYECFTDEDVSVPAASITLSKNTYELSKGKQAILYAIVYPENATDQSVIWTSSDESIVTVAKSGKIVAKNVGQAIITATTVDGDYSASCTVSVVE